MAHFADLQIRYDVSEYGIGGVIGGQLSFALPAVEYPDTAGLFPAGALVNVECSNSVEILNYYVSSRSYSGDRVNFTCIDRSYTVDRKFEMPSDKYINEYDDEGNVKSSYALIADVLNSIIDVCGYSGYSDLSGILTKAVPKISKDKLDGRSCRDILDELTRTCASFAMVQGDTGSADKRGILVFIPMNVGAASVYVADTSKYSKVCLGGIKTVNAVEMTGGSKTCSAGSASTPFGTLSIDTPYASNAAAGAVYWLLKDYEYRAWECDDMLLDSFIPLPSSIITFPEGDLYVNHCTVSLTSSGIYASMGRNAVSEDEIGYLNRTERELNQRYRLGDVKKNTVIDDNGVQLVFENKNGDSEKYGFTTFAGGVAEFAGAMVSKMLPTGKFIATSGGECFRANYNGKLYDYSYTEDSDGNISLFRNEVNSGG